jgi:hypothetical protein
MTMVALSVAVGFLFIGFCSARLRSAYGDTAIQIRLPAAQMKARAVGIRKDLVKVHLQPSKSYPFIKAFGAATMLPTDPAIAKQLLNRPPLTISNNEIVGDGQAIDKAPFIALARGKKIRVELTIPAHVDLKATYDADHLEITCVSPIEVTFDDPLEGVSGTQQIDSVTMSDKSVDVHAHSASTPTDKITISLDLTKSPRSVSVAAWEFLRFLLNYSV